MSTHQSSKQEKLKRGYRACLHCRSRKAKCDLGDIDSPSSPPCSRCRRESRECVFAPSRRGGSHVRRKSSSTMMGPEFEAHLRDQKVDMDGQGGHPQAYRASIHDLIHQSPSDGRYPLQPERDHNHNVSQLPNPTPPHGNGLGQGLGLGPQRLGQHDSGHGHGSSTGVSPSDHSHMSGGRATSTPSPKRRRLHLNLPLHESDVSSIVVADMQNESDALQILALASDGQGKARVGEAEASSGSGEGIGSGYGDQHGRGRGNGAVADLADFYPVATKVLDSATVVSLAEQFFQNHHQFFPLVPPNKIPRGQVAIAEMAQEEKHLLLTAIIIASKHNPAPGMKDIHDRTWAIMRGWMSDVQCLGEPPTIGLIESLLLLSENLPRDPTRAKKQGSVADADDAHSAENRQAWMLIGTAIRCAYGLGLEKHSLRLFNETERTDELERVRLTWTYCYLFDRHVSLRLGKAFWSRGPAVCFQGYSSSTQTGPIAAPGNFPKLQSMEGPPNDDYACLVQAYLELTQIMSTAHDTLWPNPARTKSLMIYGEYFKYLDEISRSIDGFRIMWAHKKWTTFPLADCVAAMLHYTNLVITAFSFQSHLERSAMRAEEENKKAAANGTKPPSLSLFPRGAAHSPDARYIFQSCDSARALVEICVNRFHPGGALRYIPWRFLLWFTYAAVLLLKAIYSGAMLRADHASTLKLIDRLIVCFSESSSDEDHPAVRYGRQLEALRKKLSVMTDSTSTEESNSPTGSQNFPLPPMSVPAGASMQRPPASVSSSTQYPPYQHHCGPHNPPQGNASDEPPWALPTSTGHTPLVAFSYPNTPVPLVAPPHYQPMSEIHDLNVEDTNHGFTTLDEFFGQEMDGGGANGFDGLDLADFWFQVGPGEAQGGFPFR